MNVQIPYKYEPRDYQIPLLRAMDSGYKRAVQVWHRKSGKEKTDWNLIIKKTQERVGNYWYIFPKLTQARKVIWDGIDQNGFRFLDHIPKSILSGEPNSTSMLIKFKNGSTLQLIGSDTFDNSIGGNPVGIVFSEYALTNPRVWGYLRPILANNGGWAIFNFTPRGENHAYDIYQLAKNDPEHWFCQLLTADDTKAISPQVLEQERQEIIKLDGNDALYQQEFFCNFTVPIPGAYYAAQLIMAYKEGRVGNVPYEPRVLVDSWWDIGRDDANAIWFTQTVGSELRIIDYHEESGHGLPHYVQVMKEKGYIYGEHTGPHDIAVTEWGTDKTRIETARQLGVNFLVCPKLSIQEGIDAGRSLFRKCWFDQTKCADGLNALKNYRREYNEEKKKFEDHPYHDWSSHGADAFRTLAVAYNYTTSAKRPTASPEEILQKKSTMQGWVHPRFRPGWNPRQPMAGFR